MIKPFDDFSDIATVIDHDLVKLKWKTAHFSEKYLVPCTSLISMFSTACRQLLKKAQLLGYSTGQVSFPSSPDHKFEYLQVLSIFIFTNK